MKYFAIAVIVVAIAGTLFIYSVTRPSTVTMRALGNKGCDPISVKVDFGPSYKGKLIDTHIHMPDDQLRWILPLPSDTTIRDYVCAFEHEGTSQVFAFFPTHSWFDDQTFAIVQKVKEQYGDLIVPFIMSVEDDGSEDGFPTVEAQKLEAMLKKVPSLFNGYGEIGLYARGDHGGPKGAPALPPDASRLQEIYPIIREYDLMIYFHLGEEQQAAFERVAAANRDIDFIFHGDQLVAYENGVQNLAALDEILDRNPNVYYGVDELYGDTWLLKPETSKEEFFIHFKNYEELLEKDVATWKPFIERHPDQVLWGTDRGWFGGWSVDPEVGIYLTSYARAFIDRLDSSVQEKFAYKNAERLLSNH